MAGDLLWYPVEGDPTIRMAPDVMVVFGRPKGDRGSYKQWEEGGIPPQVAFEIWTPNTRPPEPVRKLKFYERYGVEEYYTFDPDDAVLMAYHRQENVLIEVEMKTSYVSPLLGVRFATEEGTLQLYRPDGRRFLTFQELAIARDEERLRAETERRQADVARQLAETAQRQAEGAQRQFEAERKRVERLAEQLRALGVEPSC